MISRIFVKTHEDNDGYITDHEYVFDDPKEASKFVSLCRAVNAYGENVCLGYYETVTNVTAEIDLEELREVGKKENEEEIKRFNKTQEKKEPEKSLVGKRYLDKQRLPGVLKEVVDGPDSKWGQYVVKDLKTGKEQSI